MLEFILQLPDCCFLELFCDCAGQTFFFLLLRPICFLPNDTSQLKMLYGYPEGKYVSIRLTGAHVEAKKRRFDESFVMMLFEFLIVLNVRPWQVGLIRWI